MKKLNFFNKTLYLINTIFAILLLLSFFVPHIKPSSVGLAPILGIGIPALILINMVFVVYWIVIGFRKQLFLSAVVLLIGYFVTTPIYKLSKGSVDKVDNQLSIMSYNVRKFNMYQWIKDDSIPLKISKFITKENPDIVALQEYKENAKFKLKYPYYYNHINYNWNKTFSYPSGLAFYSKYPIINTGTVKYRKVFTSIIYADIVKDTDTIRVYNYHLESLGVVPEEENFGHKNSEGLIKRLRKSFSIQQTEVDSLNSNIYKSRHLNIVTGDMNNTAYSWTYTNLQQNLNDTFLKAGQGFGKTYDYKGFPFRIDFIFADKKLEVIDHKNYKVNYSDHYPIMATVSF